MTDEALPIEAPPTPQEPPASEQPTETAAAAPAAEAAATFDWRQGLDKADAKEIRSHNKVAGIIGAEVQRAVQADRQRRDEEGKGQERERTEQELLKLFEENADYFKTNYPRAYDHFAGIQQGRAQREIEGLRGKTRGEMANAIGRALNDVPEWQELTRDDHETLAKAIIGKDEDEVIPIFNRMAIDLVAHRRSTKTVAEAVKKAREEGRLAGRQEMAAEHLNGSEAPGLARPRGAPGGVNIKGMTDQEFDSWWEKHKG